MSTRVAKLALYVALALCAVSSACGRLRFEDLSEAGVVSDAEARDADLMVDADLVSDADLSVDADLMVDADIMDAGLDDAQLDANPADADAGPDANLPDATACAPGLTGPTCSDCVRYVDQASTAVSPTGLTWQTATRDLIQGQVQAFNATNDANGPATCQVWVREGTYYVYVDHPVNTIPLAAKALVYGGFAGTEVQLSQRRFAQHPTIISALDGPAGTNRALHPLSSSSGGYIDGFIVEQGYASSTPPHADGGGMTISGGTVRMRNMTFRANRSSAAGGAIQVQNGRLVVEDSAFESNSTDGSGGAIAMGTGSLGLTLRNVTIRGNIAGGDGGGVYSAATNMPIDFSNVLVVDNTAGGRGGGAYITTTSGTITASTFGASEAGSIASGLVLGCSSACTVQNSIFWNPSMAPELALSGAFTVRYSLVRGGVAGTGNLSVDPRFASPTDFHLLGNSPAIDAADGCRGPELDIEARPRRESQSAPNTGVGPVFSDMGAYEYQPGGSTYTTFSTLCP